MLDSQIKFHENFSQDDKMDMDAMMSHPFNYEHHHRRKPRVSSRSSQKELRDRERFYQSRSSDQYDEPHNFHQNHQIENLVVKHEVDYGDDDEKVDEEPAEDLRKSSNVNE